VQDAAIMADRIGQARLPARGSETRDFDRRVRQIVAALLATGSPRVHLVAGSVRTSARTLQRRLQGAGLTYAGVVQQVRFEVASQMLCDPAHKIGDVARTLGYSDPSHFTRAFQRWTGQTPRDFRRRQVAAATDRDPGPPRR
jgi:AraC-like DNA-binding protein